MSEYNPIIINIIITVNRWKCYNKILKMCLSIKNFKIVIICISKEIALICKF